mmetsp:Transcript_29387/g.70938  ORF Transcript_29387/g.70938 Transcript_29387/m.70938 type:complete len:164 (-) Transcript_29387:240-731(-)
MKLISALALLFTCHASATVVENVEDSNKNKPFVVTKPFNFLLRGAVHADVLADDQCCATPEGGCAVGGDDCPPCKGGCLCQFNGLDGNGEHKFECVMGSVHVDVLADEESTCSAVTGCKTTYNGVDYNPDGRACPHTGGGCSCQHNGFDDNNEPKFDCVESTE